VAALRGCLRVRPGLVHGLGFADALSPLALTGWPLVRALAGFNLGVELGQMIAISLVLPIMFVIGLASAVLVYRYASLAVARQEPTGWSSEFSSNNASLPDLQPCRSNNSGYQPAC
jgi:hypothetical protein